MNKEWSECNKIMQGQIKKKDTYCEGINTLFTLRDNILATIDGFFDNLSKEDFSKQPFINAKGYHNKTIAYSIYHTFRIEDIVAHYLILKENDVFLTNNYKSKMNSSIITTGNELQREEIEEFSKELNIDALREYVHQVDKEDRHIISGLQYQDMRNKINESDKEALIKAKVVSDDENAAWLIDYWCNKDYRGLILMPFSRHWIMHTEAALRINDKILNK